MTFKNKTKKRLRKTVILSMLLVMLLPLLAALVPQEQSPMMVSPEMLQEYLKSQEPVSAKDEAKEEPVVQVVRVKENADLILNVDSKKETVRLIGVTEPTEDAAAYIETLTKNQNITLEYDSLKRDEDGCLLAYVYLDDQMMLNKDLLYNGFVKLKIEKQNKKYAEGLEAAQTAAKENKAGLWAEKE